MGRKYALLQGEHASVAAAIEEHYKPQGPSDHVPTDPVSVTVALADKLDTLIGFWTIDEKPTGSKDPYALRRAALGVVRILIENRVGLRLRAAWHSAFLLAFRSIRTSEIVPAFIQVRELGRHFDDATADQLEQDIYKKLENLPDEDAAHWAFVLTKAERDLLAFFHDRLKVYLRDQGARHDLIDAVITPQSDDLLQIVRRVEALGSFLDTEDGKNLLAGTKRAANILAAEEKKKTAVAETVEPALFRQDAEKSLFAAVNQAEREAGEAIQNQDFSAAMLALSALREPVDSFFEHVLVNDEDVSVRANRLALLARIREATGQVADFSKIAG